MHSSSVFIVSAVKYHVIELVKFFCLYHLQLHLNCTRQNAKKAVICDIFGCFESKRRHIMLSGHRVLDLHATVSITAELCMGPSERWYSAGLSHVMRWSWRQKYVSGLILKWLACPWV